MKRQRLPRIALLPLLLATLACRQQVQQGQQGQAGLPQPDHVVIVLEENHGFGQIFGATPVVAPYMNRLAKEGALLTHYYSFHHPSQPNYIELFSGGEQGVTNDTCPTSLFPARSLGGALLQAQRTFKGYAEGLPAVGSLVCTTGCPAVCTPGDPQCCYARRHCPWTEFSDVPATLSVPFSQFPTDFTQLPTVSIVIPNLNDDMHNGTIQQADTWLQQNLAAYIEWAQRNNSLFILTWDENENEDKEPPNTTPPQNQIGTLLVGARVKPGSTSATVYNPHDLLRTLEDMYGLPLLGGSGGASEITGIWQPLSERSR
jgi:phosphatidylinositol-3-phosphatase